MQAVLNGGSGDTEVLAEEVQYSLNSSKFDVHLPVRTTKRIRHFNSPRPELHMWVTYHVVLFAVLRVTLRALHRPQVSPRVFRRAPTPPPNQYTAVLRSRYQLITISDSLNA
jgi:hypothetical protein